MHRRHDGQPVLAPQPGDELERLLLVADVERARRLVEQQDRRLLGERPGDHEPLALAAAQRAEPAPANGPSSSRSSTPATISRSWRVAAGEVADVRRPAEQHVLDAGHVVGDQRLLRHVGDELRPPAARARRQRARRRRATSPRALDEADDGPQQRRLAGAVGADEPEPLAGARPWSLNGASGDGAAVGRRRRSRSSSELIATPCRARSTTRKNGAPRNAVTTPIGVSAGSVSTRPGMSARIRNAAPSSTDSGSTRR